MSDSTCWTVIRSAAEGSRRAREEFSRLYLPVVRAYLGARWRASPLKSEIDDATQEVFVACFREQGALEALDPERGATFRAFLFGVVRNVARRFETRDARRKTRPGSPLIEEAEGREDGAGTLFDREWARALMREAATRQRDDAKGDDAALRRVDLLRLRFTEGLPIREIALLWDCAADDLHREYPKARAEFAAALVAVMAFHHPGAPGEVRRECGRLLAILR